MNTQEALAKLRTEVWRDCWLVVSHRPTNKGYIRIRVDGRMTIASRLVLEQKIGRPLAEGEVADHLCHNQDVDCYDGPYCAHRRCINPDHLRVALFVDNWRAGRGGAPEMWRARTHCPAGHPYAGRNVAPANGTGGGRRCRACHRARAAGRDPRLEPAIV